MNKTIFRFLSKSVSIFIVLTFIGISCSSDNEEEGGGDNPSATTEEKLPLFTVNTNGATIVDEPKINADVKVTVNDTLDFEGKIGIEIRGSSSQTFPKKSYGFETRDAANEDLDVSILGFPEEEDWILYGPYSDKSLMRNVLIYDLSREMNRYASRTKFVELQINGNNQGVYVFMEKLKRDNARIDINKLKDDENTGEDLTGGYIIKIDKNDNGGFTAQNSFTSTYGSSLQAPSAETRFLYEYPKPDDITAEQRNYITTYINDFETALAASNFTDTTSGYNQYIDVDSFIDFFLLNELSNNVDGYRISTFMHKDKNEKLKMGPIWDFNLGFGNADYCNGGKTNVWAYKFNERCPDDYYQVPFWWGRLLEDPAFVTKLKTRWSALRTSTFSNSNIQAKVDDYVKLLASADTSKNNFQTWPILGTYIWPNNFIGQTYTDETNFLKSWLSDRLTWMDNEISGF